MECYLVSAEPPRTAPAFPGTLNQQLAAAAAAVAAATTIQSLDAFGVR